MNMKECIWNHVHLVNDNILAEYDWKGKLDIFNIVLLGIPNELPGHDRKYELHRLLSALLSTELRVEERFDILEKEYNIIPESDFKKELSEMCNLSQGILERGLEQGLEQRLERGLEQGMERGLEQGKDEEQKRVIYNMNNQGLDADSISRFTGLSIEKVKSILSHLEQS